MQHKIIFYEGSGSITGETCPPPEQEARDKGGTSQEADGGGFEFFPEISKINKCIYLPS